MIGIFISLIYIKGPSYWEENYSVGNHQSPIDIQTKMAEFDPILVNKPLELNFNKECFHKIENTGHSFKVSGSEGAISSKLINKKI